MLFRILVGGWLAALASVTWAQSNPSVVEIPISLGTDNYIHLSVRVNGGKPLDFIFDTGASTCVLTDLGKAKVSGLNFDGSQETLGSGGVTKQPTASKVKLSLANIDWPSQSLMYIDYHGSLHADGVIGYNLFSGKTIQIDYDRGALEVYNRPPKLAAGIKPVNVTMRDDLAFIPVTVSTSGSTQTDLFAVDTGYGGALFVAGSFAQKANLPGDLETLGKGKSGGTGAGAVTIAAVRLPLVTLGGQSMKSVPADVQQNGPYQFKTWNILGNELTKRFNLVWDIAGKKMYFSPSRHFSELFKGPGDKRLRLIVLIFATLALVLGFLFLLRKKWPKVLA